MRLLDSLRPLNTMGAVADDPTMHRILHSRAARLTLTAAASLAGAASLATSSLAQPAVPASAVRAINLARTTAVAENGGLSFYRPAQCMFQTANPENACLIQTPDDNNNNNNARDNRSNRNNDSYVFRFFGGPPGWQQQNKRPSVETEISISSDGRRVLQIDYNGKPR